MSIRNSLSDLHHFVAWYEQMSRHAEEDVRTFTPAGVTTPTITRYRAYLQRERQLRPASVNRTLNSLKGYFGWLVQQKPLFQNPAKVVKLVEQEEPPLVISLTRKNKILWQASPPLEACDIGHSFSCFCIQDCEQGKPVPCDEIRFRWASEVDSCTSRGNGINTARIYVQGTKQDLQHAVETIAWV